MKKSRRLHAKPMNHVPDHAELAYAPYTRTRSSRSEFDDRFLDKP